VAGLRLRRTATGFEVGVTRGFDGTLALREPSWAEGFSVRVNGEPAAAPAGTGFRRLRRAFRAGDRIVGSFDHRLQLVRPDGREMPLLALGEEPVRAALYCGPFLVGVDEAIDPLFFSEPWPGNVVTLPADLAPSSDSRGRPRLAASYEHDGYRGSEGVTLRAMGEKPADDQRTFAVWLNYRSATPRSS
jgi:hypothetical protein